MTQQKTWHGTRLLLCWTWIQFLVSFFSNRSMMSQRKHNSLSLARPLPEIEVETRGQITLWGHLALNLSSFWSIVWIYSFRLCPEVPSLPAYLTEHESLWWLKKHSTSNKCNPRFYITMPLLGVHLSWGVQIMGIALMTRRGSHSTKTSKMILNLIGIHWLPSSVGTPQGNKGESVCLILLEQKGKEQLSGKAI